MSATLDKILEEIQELNDDEQGRLHKLLAEKARASETPKSIEELAAEQGVGPMDFEELQALGDFWPEDESVDDFLAALREWRRESSTTKSRSSLTTATTTPE